MYVAGCKPSFLHTRDVHPLWDLAVRYFLVRQVTPPDTNFIKVYLKSDITAYTLLHMDPIKNPFSPGAGSPPPELVERDPILEQARILLGRIKAKRPEKSLLLTGLRGVGKTVLLNEIERLARADGYRTLSIEAHEDKPLGPLIAPNLRTLLYDLNRLAGAGDKVKRGLAVLRSFVGALTVTVGEVSLGLDIDPEEGTADSGDLEIDLPHLFVAVAEAAEERESAVAVLIDELQYFSHKELGALIMALHKVQQRQLPLVLLGAGLPGLAGESKSYAERLFSFPDIGALSEEDTATALREPARAAGVAFEPNAWQEVFRLTNASMGNQKGYGPDSFLIHLNYPSAGECY